MFNFCIIIFCLISSSFADTTFTVPGGGGAAEMLGETKIPSQISGENPEPTEKRVKVSMTCTAADGTRYKPSDEGYNQCLSAIKSKSNEVPTKVYPTGGTVGPSATVNF